jgi:hypothetical protein
VLNDIASIFNHASLANNCHICDSFAIVFLAGMAVEYYIVLAELKKIELLFGFLTWVGSGADLLGVLREWYEDRREQDRKPLLKLDGIIFIEYRGREEQNTKFDDTYYYLILTKSKGEGSVTNCALADIPEQGIRNRSLIWRKPRLEFISMISKRVESYFRLDLMVIRKIIK